jgi:hypothetical protein
LIGSATDPRLQALRQCYWIMVGEAVAVCICALTFSSFCVWVNSDVLAAARY